MSNIERATVSDLNAYWKYVQTLADGEIIGQYIPLSRMPAWEDVCFELNWQIHRLDSGYFSKKGCGYLGVYRLIGLDEDGKRPTVFNRVCGQDQTGTLYIGHSKCLSDRLNQLRRSLRSNEDSHGAARMLITTPLLKFTPDRLAVAMLFTDRATRLVESNLIEAYMNSYGDTPPLNYAK